MLFSSKHIAVCTLCIEEIYVPVLHANNKVHIEKCLFTALSPIVFNSIVGFAIIAVFIPPVNVLRIGFKEFDKLLFRSRGGVKLNERQQSMVFSPGNTVSFGIIDSLFRYFPIVFFIKTVSGSSYGS